ncbi:hypothetical protein DYB36_005209 [Aphanomyces astaci]|uniref:Clathrin light chain n=1 Tax=Aphanomyces astaci TaxID=112090 RepID=A0A397B4M3_APHAT|nr:hypothetical protein DYB36_005209 [Aphanomyces astaci]
MTIWAEVAAELNRMPGFSMVKKPGSLKTRFEYLLAKHEKGESASLRKSGTTEEYSERVQLLTDIKLRVDDFAENEAVRKDAAKRKLEGVDNSGLIMRQLAMAELEMSSEKTEDAEITPIKRPKKSKKPAPTLDIVSLMGIIREGIEDKERREAQRLQYDREQANRHAEQLAAQQRVLQFEAAHLEPENNHWTQVYDFNDPNKTGENWKLSHDAVEPWIIPLDQIVPSPDSLGPLENPVPATATPIVAHDTSMQSFSIDTSQEAASAAVDAAAPAVESSPSPPHEDDFVPAPDTTDASFYDENPAAVPVHDTPEPVHEVAAPPPAPAALVTQQSWPVLNEFEAKMAAEVEAKREEEERLIREVKSKAEEELDKYYGDRTDKLAHRAATNRYVYCLEDEKKKSQELLVEMASEKPWNRVTDLVDTNVAPKPKVEGAANTGKKDAAADDFFDTSRMRSLLLQLKNSGGPEATAQ